MKEHSFISALISVAIISAIIVIAISLTIQSKKVIGPAIILLGFIPWTPLRISGRSIKSTGADIIFGYEMLIRQGVKAFELWTGKSARQELMKKVVLDRLEKNSGG